MSSTAPSSASIKTPKNNYRAQAGEVPLQFMEQLVLQFMVPVQQLADDPQKVPLLQMQVSMVVPVSITTVISPEQLPPLASTIGVRTKKLAKKNGRNTVTRYFMGPSFSNYRIKIERRNYLRRQRARR